MLVLMWLCASVWIGSVGMMLVTVIFMTLGTPFIGDWAMALGWLVLVGIAMGALQGIIGVEKNQRM